MKGTYLYGVIKLDDSQNLSLDGLTLISHQSVAAVVEEKEVKDYHELPKEETVKELISHQQMIEKIMEQLPILPVKFGTILKNEEEVRSTLEKGYFFLGKTLREIKDKIELDLVCFWNEQKAAQMAFQESSKVKNFYKKMASRVVRSNPGSTSDGDPKGLLRSEEVKDKIALGKLVADYLASKKDKISFQVLKVLKKEAVESCRHALADINMLLNQAFLVKKRKEEAFNHALNKLDSQFTGLLNFRLVGPLPPYSFATLVVESLAKKEVEKARQTMKINGRLSLKGLKQTYDQLAKGLHPDKGGNPLEFERATAAYKLLKNFIQNGLISVSLYKWEEL